MEPKIDPYTGETFIPKRTNQIYASRKNQIAHNNQKAKELRDAKREVNRHLNNNLNILKRLLKEKKSIIVSRDYLEGAEFTFGVFTQEFLYEDRKFKIVYNYGYTMLEDKKYLLKDFSDLQ